MPAPTLATAPLTVDPERRYSLAEWQLIEEATGERYEYHEGKLVSVRATKQWGGEAGAPLMSQGTGPHALIGANLLFALGSLVRSRGSSPGQETNGTGARAPCGVYTSDLRLMIEVEARYVYPDAAVICGQPVYDEVVSTAARNPLLVVEVVSPRSERFDAGDKFDYYGSLESLRDYVLVSQDRARVEVRSRKGAAAPWTLAVSEGLGAAAVLPSLSAELPLREVFRLVEFA